MAVLNTKQFCSLFGISKRTLHRYMEEGMPYLQIVPRGKLFFNLQQVMPWMQKRNDSYRKYLRKKGD